MKKIGLMLVLFSMAVTLFVGCKKDDDTNNNNETYSMTLTVNGATTTYKTAYAKYDEYYSNGNRVVQWSLIGSGDSPDYPSVGFGIDSTDYHQAGTYDLDGTGGSNFAVYWPKQDDFPYYTDGSHPAHLVITSDDGTTVSGTFSFSVDNGTTTDSITNGSFKAKYRQ